MISYFLKKSRKKYNCAGVVVKSRRNWYKSKRGFSHTLELAIQKRKSCKDSNCISCKIIYQKINYIDGDFSVIDPEFIDTDAYYRVAEDLSDEKHSLTLEKIK